MSLKDIIVPIFEKHLENAQGSEYDRHVLVQAARLTRFKAIELLDNEENLNKLIIELESFKNHYNDSEGIYTNGRSIINAIIDDLRLRC